MSSKNRIIVKIQKIKRMISLISRRLAHPPVLAGDRQTDGDVRVGHGIHSGIKPSHQFTCKVQQEKPQVTGDGYTVIFNPILINKHISAEFHLKLALCTNATLLPRQSSWFTQKQILFIQLFVVLVIVERYFCVF